MNILENLIDNEYIGNVVIDKITNERYTLVSITKANSITNGISNKTGPLCDYVTIGKIENNTYIELEVPLSVITKG